MLTLLGIAVAALGAATVFIMVAAFRSANRRAP